MKEVKKLSKIGQEQRDVISAFAYLLIAITSVLF